MKEKLDKILNTSSIFSSLPIWTLASLFVLSSLLSVYSLRQNNQNMVKLRDAVYQADKDSGDVNAALNNLRSYVHSHMNTNLSSGTNIKPPIHLKYTYERLQSEEYAKAAAINERVYTEAQAHCERLNPGSVSGRTRIPCVEDYVSRNGTHPKQIPASLYQFDFVSPSWTPDLAGWSVVMTCLMFLALASSLAAGKFIRSKAEF